MKTGGGKRNYSLERQIIFLILQRMFIKHRCRHGEQAEQAAKSS